MATEPAPPLEQLRKEVDTTLALVDASRIDLAYLLLRIIEKGRREDRPILLQHVAESWDHTSSSGELQQDPVIDQHVLDGLKDQYAPVVDGALESMLRANPPVATFYADLYELLCNPLFRTENARAFALYWVLIDVSIPYFHLDRGLHLADDDWRALGDQLRRPRQRVRFILKSKRLNRRSEQADLLLKELDAVSDEVARVVLMASIVFELQLDTDRLRRAVADQS